MLFVVDDVQPAMIRAAVSPAITMSAFFMVYLISKREKPLFCVFQKRFSLCLHHINVVLFDVSDSRAPEASHGIKWETRNDIRVVR